MAYNLLALLPAHRKIVSEIRQLFPDETDDDLLDTIAGESNLNDAIIATLRAAVERTATAEALGALIDTMTARRRRMEAGAQSLRSSAMEAMLGAGIPKITAPDMTITIGQSKPKVIITNPDAIPANLCRVLREPNKAEIAKALAAGDVPGAAFGNAGKFLSVRMS